MVTNAVTLLFLLGFTAALAPHRALRSPSLSTPNGFLSNHRLREATVVLATDDETAVEEETAAVEGEAAPSIISALNPFSTTSSAEARVARQEAEMGGALPETILSTTGIKERLSSPDYVAGSGEKSVFKKVGPLVFFSAFPIIVGLFGYQEFAKTGFDVTVPIRLIVESLLILAPVRLPCMLLFLRLHSHNMLYLEMD